MLKPIQLISLSVIIFVLSACNNIVENKVETNFIDSVFVANKIQVDTSKSILISFLPINDCQSCMYRANDVFNELLFETKDFPKSNIIFVTNNIRDKEIDYVFNNTYSFNVKKYNLIKSDIFISKLLEEFNESYSGTCVFILDKNKELLYYNVPKKIYNMDSLAAIINK